MTIPTRIYASFETGRWILLAGSLLVYAALLFMSARATDHLRKFVFWCAAPLLIFAAGPSTLPQHVLDNKAPGHFLQQHASAITPSATLVSDRNLIGAVCWYCQRSDVFIIGGPGEMKYGASYDDSRHRLLELKGFGELVSQCPAGSSVFLIVSQERYGNYAHDLPTPVSSVAEHGLVLVEFATDTSLGSSEP